MLCKLGSCCIQIIRLRRMVPRYHGRVVLIRLFTVRNTVRTLRRERWLRDGLESILTIAIMPLSRDELRTTGLGFYQPTRWKSWCFGSLTRTCLERAIWTAWSRRSSFARTTASSPSWSNSCEVRIISMFSCAAIAFVMR